MQAKKGVRSADTLFYRTPRPGTAPTCGFPEIGKSGRSPFHTVSYPGTSTPAVPGSGCKSASPDTFTGERSPHRKTINRQSGRRNRMPVLSKNASAPRHRAESVPVRKPALRSGLPTLLPESGRGIRSSAAHRRTSSAAATGRRHIPNRGRRPGRNPSDRRRAGSAPLR